MRNTKLVFIDGLPGLGKTTTTYALHSRLRTEGVKAKMYEEHASRHPLNAGGRFHPAGNTPGDQFFKRYTSEKYTHESLNRWQKYIHSAVKSSSITVLDSYPFQNSVRVLLQLDADPGSIQAYASQVETMVSPLQPVLIYFNHPDPSSALNQLSKIGAQRGQAWMDYAVALITHCPYCIARGLVGLEGAMTFMMAYKQMIDTLLGSSQVPRLVLENCGGNWDMCYQKIERFLGLA